jgi:hypothetical protein
LSDLGIGPQSVKPRASHSPLTQCPHRQRGVPPRLHRAPGSSSPTLHQRAGREAVRMKKSITHVLQVNWIHTSTVEEWLQDMKIGRTLNMCCGMSKVGDVRIDRRPETNRTGGGDLFKLDYPPMSFDTVICDPPFEFYNKFDWILRLSDIARKRFLLSPDRTTVKLRGWETSLYAFTDRMYLRLYYCFDRRQSQLHGFGVDTMPEAISGTGEREG